MKNIYLLVLSLFLLFSCSPNVPKDGTGEASASTEVEQQLAFTEKAKPKYAKHFSVSYHDNYKLVRTNATFYPNGKEAESKSQDDVLVLVQKGTNPPPLEGELASAQVLYIPAATVAVNVQHSESFLRELGLVDRINAIGGLYSYDNAMRTKALQDEIGQIGYSWHSPPDIEVLLSRQPELFLMTLASMSHTESLEKCRQLDVPTAAVFDWAEQDYLARAEWIKFYSLFFNAEAKANEVFQMIENRVEELKQLAASTAGGSPLWIIGDIHASPLPKEEIMSSFEAWNKNQLYHNMERVDPKHNTSDWYATAIVRPDSVLADLISLVYPDVLPDHQPQFMGAFDKASGGTSPVQ